MRFDVGRERGCCTSPESCNAQLILGHREQIVPLEWDHAFLLGWFMCVSICLPLAVEFSTYWPLVAELGGGEASDAALFCFLE